MISIFEFSYRYINDVNKHPVCSWWTIFVPFYPQKRFASTNFDEDGWSWLCCTCQSSFSNTVS